MQVSPEIEALEAAVQKQAISALSFINLLGYWTIKLAEKPNDPVTIGSVIETSLSNTAWEVKKLSDLRNDLQKQIVKDQEEQEERDRMKDKINDENEQPCRLEA